VSLANLLHNPFFVAEASNEEWTTEEERIIDAAFWIDVQAILRPGAALVEVYPLLESLLRLHYDGRAHASALILDVHCDAGTLVIHPGWDLGRFSASVFPDDSSDFWTSSDATGEQVRQLLARARSCRSANVMGRTGQFELTFDGAGKIASVWLTENRPTRH
jgi:hypothetical protein